LLLVLFFISGASGLLLELVWIRMAGTVIGNTTFATGTVVAVFMGGLALGSRLGGREADRRQGPALVRLYGSLEAGVALASLAVPFLLQASKPLYVALWASVGEVTPLFAGLRIVLVTVVLIAPTTLMGATLPVLSRILSSAGAGMAREAGWAYAVNTLGGVAGTLAGGFLLIPALGLERTLVTAAGLNLGLAAASFALARKAKSESAEVPPTAHPPGKGALLLAAFSGFTALSYEVAWTRSLVLSLGSTVQALTLILSSFILGLALGSALASRMVIRVKEVSGAIGGVQSILGAAALVLLPILGRAPLFVAGLFGSGVRSYDSLLVWESLLIGLVILGPATLLGAIFPLACHLAAGSDGAVGRTVGAVYAWNTFGSIAGTLLATFGFIPWLGVSWTIKGIALLNLGLGGALLARSSRGRRMAWAPVAAGVCAWAVPGTSARLMTSGAYLYGPTFAREAESLGVDLSEVVAAQSPPLAEYWDAYGLVSVHAEGPARFLRINGKVDASTGSGSLDMLTQLYAGHLALLHHPDPRRVLVIGLGSGSTLGAVVRHPVEHVDCVEISPGVVRAAAYFAEATGHPLADRRVHLMVGDGRNLVQFSRDLYDVIISEPSNLWVSGMAHLFTRDFFEEVRRKLTPRGIFCQWIYSSGLEAEDFRLVLRTFFGAFPAGSLWEIHPGGDYLLLGGERIDPLPYDQFEARASAPGVGEDLGDPGLPGALSVGGHLLGEAREVRVVAGPGPAMTDDHPTLEYSAPRSLYRETRAATLRMLEPLRLDSVERSHYDGLREETANLLAQRRMDRGLLARAVESYWTGGWAESLRLLDGMGKIVGRDRQMLSYRESVLAGLVTEGGQRLSAGDLDGAIGRIRVVPVSSPHRGQLAARIAQACRQAGRPGEARGFFAEALSDPASSFDALLGLGEPAEAEGRPQEAESRWREAIRLRPDVGSARLRLAAFLVGGGRIAEARAVCQEALRINPADANARQMLEALPRN